MKTLTKILVLVAMMNLSACAFQRAKEDCQDIRMAGAYGGYEACVQALHSEYRAQQVQSFNEYNAYRQAIAPYQQRATYTRCYATPTGSVSCVSR